MASMYVRYDKPQKLDLLTGFALAACIVLGLLIGVGSVDLAQTDLTVLVTLFVALPVLTSCVAYYLGWHMKKHTVSYAPPKWTFEEAAFSLDEVRRLRRSHNTQYLRLVARSSFWHFYLPILCVLLSAAIPLTPLLGIDLSSSTRGALYLANLLILASVSGIGGFLSTSNDASHDFSLPLLREASALAKTQASIHGVSGVQLVMDRATVDGLTVYRRPRVRIGISGLEGQVGIESISDELGSVRCVQCTLYPRDGHAGTVWLWTNTDRTFRKRTGVSDDVYYVRNPVHSMSRELGVKDVSLVTMNAIALAILEWRKLHGSRSDIDRILEDMGCT
ncbi:MAG: hypothetical protein HXY34_07435 [Candidatus Thorarchaeota archaeon]|nr:hypothetical protein [Candidatus Thorarchaeota archaeon]